MLNLFIKSLLFFEILNDFILILNSLLACLVFEVVCQAIDKTTLILELLVDALWEEGWIEFLLELILGFKKLFVLGHELGHLWVGVVELFLLKLFLKDFNLLHQLLLIVILGDGMVSFELVDLVFSQFDLHLVSHHLGIQCFNRLVESCDLLCLRLDLLFIELLGCG